MASGYSQLSEHQIQVALFAAYRKRRMPGAIMFAIPNGGERRDAASGRQLRLEGVTAGAPDIFCSVLYERPSGSPLRNMLGSHRTECFLIELKTENGKLSPAQKKFHPQLVAAGCEVVVCRGFLEAIRCLEERGIIRRPNTQVSHAKDKRSKASASGSEHYR